MSLFLSFKQYDVMEDLFKLQQKADEQRIAEYNAALKIQAWFRGNRIRKYMRFLHDTAAKIQSTFRMFTTRKRYYVKVKEALVQRKEAEAHKAAAKIQKIWRGYYTRKYIHNYYARRNYLLAVEERNIEIREQLARFAQNQKEIKEREERMKFEEEKILLARKHHYMMSTYQQNGVFASPWFPNTGFEDLIAQVPPLSKEERKNLMKPIKSEGSEKNSPRELPPLKNVIQPKQQGPFRDPTIVHNQRYRALSPTLRVATSINAVKEDQTREKQRQWIRRINDDPMKFSTDAKKYVPMIHTKEKFERKLYGQKSFREEKENSTAFKTVVPSIPLFDKFGKEATLTN